jgi:AbrB family looped-hinge helix DNA binding protein
LQYLETTMTQKGQVTIPADLRARLGLRPGDRVAFEWDGASARIVKASSRVLRSFGSIEPHGQPMRGDDPRGSKTPMPAANP